MVGAIVIGGHFQGLGVIRSLGRHGIPIVLFDSEPCISRFSKYVSHVHRCPEARKEMEFLDFLIYMSKMYSGWVIYPTDDEIVRNISKNHGILCQYYRLTTPDWKVIRFLYSKKASYQKAESIGVPIPKTFYPESEKHVAGHQLSYPVIIKPTIMRKFFKMTGKKAFRADNEEELLKLYRMALKAVNPEEIMIQEMIPEASKHLYSFCPFFKNGNVVARIIAKRSRQHPMDFGHASTYVETVDIPVLEKIGRSFLKSIQYYGIGEVEFIYDTREEVYKFLEVNPRVWGWHSISSRAGVDFPWLIFQDLTDQEIHVNGFKKNIKWIRLMTDFPTALMELLKLRMPLKEYLLSLKGQKAFAVAAIDDPLPFFGEIMLLPYLLKKRGF
jgi:predicted ATP-grasp superfamily ATP-dependent carboligase